MADEVTKQDLHDMEDRLKAHTKKQLEAVETRLLSAFHGWARSMEIRVRGVSTVTSGLDERMALIEERVSDLERRKSS